MNKKTKEIRDFITAVKAKTYERHFVSLPASDRKLIQSARYDDLSKSLLIKHENSRANSNLSNNSKKKQEIFVLPKLSNLRSSTN